MARPSPWLKKLTTRPRSVGTPAASTTAVAALVLIPVSCGRGEIEMANRAGCVSNLNSISKGLTVYKSANDDCYTMISGEKWATPESGTNHTVSPFDEKTGDPEVKTSGFAGGECHKATKDLESLLGKVASTKNTAEFHKASTSVGQTNKAAN